MVKLFAFDMVKTIKSNYSLVPLIALLGFGTCLATFTSFRTLSRSPDVVINRRGNPKPYESMVNDDGTGKQYKLYTRLDYAKIKLHEDRPNI